jgi:hypothetical protein
LISGPLRKTPNSNPKPNPNPNPNPNPKPGKQNAKSADIKYTNRIALSKSNPESKPQSIRLARPNPDPNPKLVLDLNPNPSRYLPLFKHSLNRFVTKRKQKK